MIKWFAAALLVLALASPADAMTFQARWNGGHCDRDCGWVAAIGEITSKTPAEFAQIAALPEADQPVVRVRGDGGLTYQKIIDVLSLAKAKGLTKAALDSEIR